MNDEGERRKRDGQQRSFRAANEDWVLEVEAFIHGLRAGTRFTTDDVLHATDAAKIYTHENRALGAIMRRFAKHGYITSTTPPVYVQSERTVDHRRPKRQWIRI